MEKVKCLIIGSGPAGYTAAIYTARANLRPVLYEGIQPGGQLTTTSEVENFPGYPRGINSLEMMEDIKNQAEKFGADIRRGVVTKAELHGCYPFRIEIDGIRHIEADTVIIATGATAKYLGIPGEAHYMGRGVSACAVCDGFFYRGQNVAVVGGGDTACEEASYLANMCNKVYLIVRKDYLRASHAMQKRVKDNPNIEILFEHVTKEVLGDDEGVTGIIVEDKAGERRRLDLTGFFVAIGRQPQTSLFEGQIHLDRDGYIKTEDESGRTNIRGVFAAGDVKDPNYRQAVVAAGSGCIAALDAERFLMMTGGSGKGPAACEIPEK